MTNVTFVSSGQPENDYEISSESPISDLEYKPKRHGLKLVPGIVALGRNYGLALSSYAYVIGSGSFKLTSLEDIPEFL